MENIFIWILAFFSVVAFIKSIQRLKDNRGEIAPKEEDTTDEKDDDLDGLDDLESISLDDIDLEEEDPEKKKKKETPPDQDDKDQQNLKEIQKKLDDLEVSNKQLLEDKKSLNIALHQERQKSKKASTEASKEESLTREQIIGIMKEHKDDPEVLYNVFDYMSKQGKKDIEKKAVDASKIAQKKNQIDSEITKMFPDLSKDGSELRSGVDKIKSDFDLDKNPFGDFFAMGVLTLNNLQKIQKEAYEKGKSEALRKNANDKIKEDVKDKNTPEGKKKKKDNVFQLSTDQMKTAKENIGLKGDRALKVYARLLSKKNSMVEVD